MRASLLAAGAGAGAVGGGVGAGTAGPPETGAVGGGVGAGTAGPPGQELSEPVWELRDRRRQERLCVGAARKPGAATRYAGAVTLGDVMACTR